MEDDWQYDFFNNYFRILIWIIISGINTLAALCGIALLSLAIRAGYRSCKKKRAARQQNKTGVQEDCVLGNVDLELDQVCKF